MPLPPFSIFSNCTLQILVIWSNNYRNICIVRHLDLLNFDAWCFGLMLWGPRFGGSTKERNMTHEKDQDSHQLIDLGAATTVTKGVKNNGPQDDPTSLRIYNMGLDAE